MITSIYLFDCVWLLVRLLDLVCLDYVDVLLVFADRVVVFLVCDNNWLLWLVWLLLGMLWSLVLCASLDTLLFYVMCLRLIFFGWCDGCSVSLMFLLRILFCIACLGLWFDFLFGVFIYWFTLRWLIVCLNCMLWFTLVGLTCELFAYCVLLNFVCGLIWI